MKTKPKPTDQGGIPARMNTTCRGCGLPIRKGDPIFYERGWQIHVGCPGADATGGLNNA